MPTVPMQEQLDAPDQGRYDMGQPGPVVDANGFGCPPSGAGTRAEPGSRLYLYRRCHVLESEPCPQARSGGWIRTHRCRSFQPMILDFSRQAGPRLNLSYRIPMILAFKHRILDSGLECFRIAAGSNNLRLPGDIGLATDDFSGAITCRSRIIQSCIT